MIREKSADGARWNNLDILSIYLKILCLYLIVFKQRILKKFF
jgi:hypothetical protein